MSDTSNSKKKGLGDEEFLRIWNNSGSPEEAARTMGGMNANHVKDRAALIRKKLKDDGTLVKVYPSAKGVKKDDAYWADLRKKIASINGGEG
jgi:hypothetical protein